MSSALHYLRAIPTLAAAAVCYLGLLLYLICIRYPWYRLSRGDTAGPGLLVSALFQAGLLAALGWVVIVEQAAPLPELLQVEIPTEADSPALTLLPESAPKFSPGDLEIVGVRLASEAMPALDVEHPTLHVKEPGTGSGLFDFGGVDQGQEIGSSEGIDTGGTKFFGVNASGNAFVFVVDISGSMDGLRFRRARAELHQTIESLQEEQSYCIIFYNHNTFVMPPGKLVPANQESFVQTKRWIKRVRCTGNTDPEPALRLAVRMHPDAVFLLSDGEFDRLVAVRVSESQTGFRVPIHTIGFTNREGEPVLKAISELTGGTYRYVR